MRPDNGEAEGPHLMLSLEVFALQGLEQLNTLNARCLTNHTVRYDYCQAEQQSIMAEHNKHGGIR